MKHKITTIGAIVGLVAIFGLYGVLFKTYDYLNCKYATWTALAQTDKKVDENKKDMDVYKLTMYQRDLQRQIWDLQDRLEKKPDDATAKKVLRKYQNDYAVIEQQIKDIRGK